MPNQIRVCWFAESLAVARDLEGLLGPRLEAARRVGLCRDLDVMISSAERPVPRVGAGTTSTRVLLGAFWSDRADDPWSTVVLLRLVRALAVADRRLTAVVTDGGGYVLPGSVRIWSNTIEAYWPLVSLQGWLQRSEFKASGFSPAVPITPVRLDDVDPGTFFRIVRANTVADEPTVRDLALSAEQLATMTLEEVADRIRFPWDDANLPQRSNE